MDLSDAIAEYLEARKGMGYAKNTIRTDTQALKILLAEVGNIRVKHLDARHGEKFLARLNASGVKPGTYNLYRGSLRRFSAWCIQRRYLPGSANPLGMSRNLKNETAPKRRIQSAEFARLLDLCDHPQQRIIVALGLYLFLRASEIEDLSVGDVDFAAREIRVWQRKTKRYDVMPISKRLDRELRRWLTWFANDAAERHGGLQKDWPLVPARIRTSMFNDGTGKGGGRPFWPASGHMNPRSRVKQVHTRIKPVLVRFGWEVTAEDREGEHTLRRSGARALYNRLITVEGAARDDALGIVQAMLHHKTRAQTEHYIGVTAEVEKRDLLLKGADMFGEDESSNVVSLDAAPGPLGVMEA
jgi:integrase